MKNNLPNTLHVVETDTGYLIANRTTWVSSYGKPIEYIPKSRYDLAVRALKYIANSTPSPEQTFEIENKLAAQNALKELGE